MSATATNEELLKQAELEMFVKIATKSGVDLDKLTNDQINNLYAEVFQKRASGENPFPPKDDEKSDEEKKKDEEAKASKEKEEAEKAASEQFASLQTKQAEAAWADKLGRVMAHSYVDELSKIAAAQNGQEAADGAAAEPAKTASAAPAAPVVSLALPAIDQLALVKAAEIARASDFDPEQAFARVQAVATLGLTEEGSKVAQASSVEQAVELRALEYLESAGYPVTWGDSK